MLKGATDQDKLDDLCRRPYKDQAIWFLNGFWKKLGDAEAKNIWKWKHKFDTLDLEKGKEGNQLDELNAHRFLESFNETLTVQALRSKLAEVGVDKNTKRKYVPFVHYLIFKYKVDLHALVTASQGDNQEEIEQAQRMLDAVSRAFVEVQATAETAKKREQESRIAEAAAKQAQAELEQSLAELKAQEDAFNNKTAELKQKSETGSVVQMNKAKNELAQHLSSDPLPLRRAKLNSEAAVRKAERASKAAEEAVAAAEAARIASEEAVEDARRKVAEAEAYLDEVRSKPGSAQGQIWWMQEELNERKAYLPKSKGGVEKGRV